VETRAVRRRHCVGGAPVNFDRRQNFLMTFFSHQKLQQNKYTATMASASRQQIFGVDGAPINRSRGGAYQLSAAAVAWL